MSRFLSRAQTLALALGAPGLFLVTFLDSSFLSLPEATDLLLIWMVVQHKSRMVFYASTAVAGSVLGCLALYVVGRKGGDALVRSRFNTGTVDKALGTIQRYGVLAVLIPCLLPPPAPFKIFIILAGIAGISVTRFVLAIAIGRTIRYFAEGFLAVRYGDQAIEYVHANGKTVSLALVGLILAGAAGYFLWTKARRRSRR
ncbi:MAG TPA: VTT domain-containing protein [Vicinamibacterales bacterium]|jgi:membrane protein YqaA with SNARE-associated domain|nr:VTT domain-containing protein [Vicinamibacterales bacterium]